MRPIKLTMIAFGPYASKQIVDFRELGDRSFFLIHGSTGAGKTTILDAICFALYGETSGVQRTAEEMRSDHSEPKLLTEIAFEFALGNEIFSVTRSPRQDKPKERGDGTTTIPAKATLWQKTPSDRDLDEEKVLAATPTEVTDKVKELFGFESKQFRQVIMLPQDEFRKFLTADSKEREEIFKTLFKTDLYERIEQTLKNEAKELEREIDQLRKNRRSYLEQANVETENQLGEEQERITQLLKSTHGDLKLLRVEEQSAQQRLSDGIEAQRRIAAKSDAESYLCTLEEKQAEIAQRKEQLDVARKSSILAEVENALLQQRQGAEDADKKHKNAEIVFNDVSTLQKIAATKFENEDGRKEERNSARKRVDELIELHRKVTELDSAKQELKLAKESASLVQAEYESANAQKEALKEKSESIKSLLAELEHPNFQLTEYRLQEEIAKKLYGQRSQLAQLIADLDVAGRGFSEIEERLRKANHEVQQARESLKAHELAWHKGQAAILAKLLANNSPCPVCGSTHHPLPAKSDDQLPSEVIIEENRIQIEHLEKRSAEMQEESRVQREKLSELRARIDDRERDLGDSKSLPLEEIEARLARASNERTNAEEREKQIAKLTKEQNDHESKHRESETTLTEIELRLKESNHREARASTLVEERSRGIPIDLMDVTILVQAGRAAREVFDNLEKSFTEAQENLNGSNTKLAEARAGLEKAREYAAEAKKHADLQQATFKERLHEVGFGNENDYQKSKLSRDRIESLDKEIQKFDSDLGAAKDRFARAKKDAQGLIEPDLQTLRSSFDEAKLNVEDCIKKVAELTARQNQIRKWLDTLKTINKKLEQSENLFGVMGRISEVANGKNSLGINFHRFVLGAKMEEVLLLASRRFLKMTQGRYSLRRTDAPTGRQRTGGLELEVRDTWTGDTTRSVKTLSGGEGFQASLALALGLADVVQSDAGGIYLETIFVDEGFGSLDTDSLERAIETLLELREGGRLVGIISHVDSLKERIDTRLEITTGTSGSRARFVFG